MSGRTTKTRWEGVLYRSNYEENLKLKDILCKQGLKDKHQNQGSMLPWRALKITEKLGLKQKKKKKRNHIEI